MEVDLYKGLIYTIPKAPKRESMANNEFTKSEQYWRRQPFPEEWQDEEVWDNPTPEMEAYAIEEDRRCTEGFWFLNNGEPTYITGDHYHYIQWFPIDSGYPQYRDKDRRWHYHWEICDKDQDCLGQAYGKHRRDGYSYRCVSIILNRARKTFNSNYGMISKTGDDAKEMFQKLIHGFLNYPPFFKPQVQSAEDVKKELVFKTPQQRVTFKNRKTKKEISLNTKIDWKNTKDNSYDSMKLKIVACDEAGKFPADVSVEKWFNIGNTCLMLGRNIIGKMLFGSTVNESDKGGAGFKKIWDNSLHSEKNDNGRTVSGLYRYFVPAWDCLEGFIDKFGKGVVNTPEKPVMGIDGVMITQGAKEYLENVLKSKKEAGDLVGYYEEVRKFPFTEDDMFREASNEGNPFSLDKIYEQIDFIASLPGGPPLRRGNFMWKQGIRDTIVEWHDDPKGRWLLAWMPPPELRGLVVNTPNGKSPGNIGKGLFSCDPYQNKTTTDKRRSEGASHGYRKFDILDPEGGETFISEYFYRHPDPDDLFEDMIMQCVFFGWPFLPESNKNAVTYYFDRRGYSNYVMERPALTHTEYSEKNQKEKGLPTTGDAVRGSLVTYLQGWIANNVGRKSDGSHHKMLFIRTLQDWAKFDPKKWTDYDLTVSSMLGVVGGLAYIPKVKPVIAFNPFQKYNVKGTQSLPIR